MLRNGVMLFRIGKPYDKADTTVTTVRHDLMMIVMGLPPLDKAMEESTAKIEGDADKFKRMMGYSEPTNRNFNIVLPLGVRREIQTRQHQKPHGITNTMWFFMERSLRGGLIFLQNCAIRVLKMLLYGHFVFFYVRKTVGSIRRSDNNRIHAHVGTHFT